MRPRRQVVAIGLRAVDAALRIPARRGLAFVWVLLALTAPAAAQRTVAVIDATSGDDAEVAAVVGALADQLEREAPDLQPVATERRPALVGAMPDEYRSAVAAVEEALPVVRDDRAAFDDAAAIAAAIAALGRAANVPPSPTLLATIADLAFERGYAWLSTSTANAERDFALVLRLDPTRALSAVKYPPDVIKAFTRAGKAAATATLDVTSTDGATVWIDGVEVGPAPASVTLAVGLHVVTVTGLRLVTRGELFEVPAAGAKLDLAAAEASATVITHRLRRMLIATDDAGQRADLVKALVTLTGSQAAILVGRDADHAVVIWRYTPLADALGAAISTDGVPAEELLKPLRPIRIPPPVPCQPGEERVDGVCRKRAVVVPPPGPPAWWQKRWVQATIGGTLLAGIVTTVVVVATQTIGTSAFTSIGFGDDP